MCTLPVHSIFNIRFINIWHMNMFSLVFYAAITLSLCSRLQIEYKITRCIITQKRCIVSTPNVYSIKRVRLWIETIYEQKIKITRAETKRQNTRTQRSYIVLNSKHAPILFWFSSRSGSRSTYSTISFHSFHWSSGGDRNSTTKQLSRLSSDKEKKRRKKTNRIQRRRYPRWSI